MTRTILNASQAAEVAGISRQRWCMLRQAGNTPAEVSPGLWMADLVASWAAQRKTKQSVKGSAKAIKRQALLAARKANV